MLKSKKLKQARAVLAAKLDELRESARANLAAMRAEGADVAALGKKDDENKKQIASIVDELAVLDDQIADALAAEDRERREPAVTGRVTDVRESVEDQPWESDGEFFQAVARAGTPGNRIDPRLLAGPTGGSTGVPSDGGFFVGTDLSLRLLDAMQHAAVLLPMCDRLPISEGSDGVELPYIDETSKANGSRFGGVQVFRAAEADTVSAKKPKYAMLDLRLEDMIGITYMTERQLQDAAATQQIVQRAFASEFSFKTDDEIYNGSGSGQMKGLLNAGCKVAVAKENGQAADTIVYENIVKMWARMPGRLRSKAVWLVSQDAEVQLQQMHMVIGTGGVPVYLPATGVASGGYSTLFGRPVVPVEHAPVLGDEGDITCAALSEYLVIEKGGPTAAESIHVRFLYNERAFRWVVRNNGAPKWRTAVTPKNGGPTLSPIVTLAAR